MINRIERPLANDHPDGSFSVHLFLHRPKTQNLRIIGQYTHNLLGLKTLSFALLLSSTKIWIKGPQIGSDMPSALGLVSICLCFCWSLQRAKPISNIQSPPQHHTYQDLFPFLGVRLKYLLSSQCEDFKTYKSITLWSLWLFVGQVLWRKQRSLASISNQPAPMIHIIKRRGQLTTSTFSCLLWRKLYPNIQSSGPSEPRFRQGHFSHNLDTPQSLRYHLKIHLST